MHGSRLSPFGWGFVLENLATLSSWQQGSQEVEVVRNLLIVGQAQRVSAGVSHATAFA